MSWCETKFNEIVLATVIGMLSISSCSKKGTKHTIASYLYAGYRATEKVVPYVRIDNLHYQAGEVYFHKNNTTALIAGARYEINYLAVVKLEYQHQKSELNGTSNSITAQFAIGF